MIADDGKPRRPRMSEEEHALWHGVTRSVAPLKRRHTRAESKAMKSPIRPAAPLAPHIPSAPRAKTVVQKPSAPPPKAAPPLVPLERRLKQRIGRGSEPVDARLDLHGQTQELAYMALLQFLRHAQKANCKTVLVVTGKGRLTAGDFGERGVLRRVLPHWLRLEEFRSYVLGFEDAPLRYGSTGAQLIRIRRTRRP